MGIYERNQMTGFGLRFALKTFDLFSQLLLTYKCRRANSVQTKVS